jgi:hypothetical protein
MAKIMIPIAEAAGLLRIGRDSLKRLCSEGRVPGAERRPQVGAINAPWWLPAAWVRGEVERRRQATGRRGRPYNLA